MYCSFEHLVINQNDAACLPARHVGQSGAKAMDELLSIRIKVADRELGLKTRPDTEIFLREAGKLVRERIDEYRRMGYKDMADIVAMVALDGMMARLRAEEQSRRLQRMVVDKLTQLDSIVTPSLLP